MNLLRYFLPPIPERETNLRRVLADLDAIQSAHKRLADDYAATQQFLDRHRAETVIRYRKHGETP